MKEVTTIKAIIVDDEELARSRLSNLLAELEGIELSGSFFTAKEALYIMENNSVDVVFLDIGMPEMDGLEFANVLLDKSVSTKVVLVTGYEEYALEAFELEALDYLLKPISRERLARTVRHLTKIHSIKKHNGFTFLVLVAFVCQFRKMDKRQLVGDPQGGGTVCTSNL